MKYKILILILIVIFTFCGVECFAQGKLTRPSQQQSQLSKPKKSNSKVTVSEPDGYINGHGYVDLGLPSGTKWATCNVGASSPEIFGEYYAWGEVQSKPSYSYENNKIRRCGYGTKADLLKVGVIGESLCLLSTYDAATYNWGEPWRMPSIVHFKELIENCKWEWLTIKGNRGFRVVGPNKKSIFIPSAGSFKKSLDGTSYRGHYHCSDGVTFNDYGIRFNKHLSFYSGGHVYIDDSDSSPYAGFPIRPIYE